MELLERGAFLSSLEGWLDAAAGGHGCMVLVGGEAGIGKTSLVRAFCERHGADARVLWGACDALRTPWPLGPLEWVFPEKPATPPLPGATYGSFGAACHYRDGTFVLARVQELCDKRSPQTGARFNFWHPELVTLHVWLWYHNPDGLYSGTNPLVQPFNRG
jgi:hypothetical protein